MRKDNLLDKYLLAKPTIRMTIEWPILIGVGIIGTVFSLQRIPFSPISNIVGIVLLLMGLIIHEYSHKIHKQAHQKSEKIEKLITESIYSNIRHPLYLGLILMYIGFAFSWGIVWILVPVVIFVIFTILMAIREEEVMKEKFGKNYKEYMRRVPWRFIPKVF
jgi:protein-S-isoprenylcysteine O-methyltransferase Ste14